MLKVVKLFLLGGLGVVVLSHTVLAISPAECAAQKPTFDERHKFGGQYFAPPPQKIWGIYGRIETGVLDICPASRDEEGFYIPSATWVWVGLDNNILTGFGSFIQMGYSGS